MTLFSVLTKHAPNKVFFSMLLAVLAGISYAFLIPMILASIEEPVVRLLQPSQSQTIEFLSIEVAHYRFAIAYFLLFIFIIATKSLSQMMMAQVAVGAARQLRVKLYQGISQLYIKDLELIGASKLLVALTSDVPRIINGVRTLPLVLTNIVTILGLLGFLVYLNINIFIILLLSMILGIVSYRLITYFGERYFRRSRNYFDQLQEAIKGLIYGAKELKINNLKRRNFYRDSLLSTEEAIQAADVKGWSIMSLATNYGDMLGFIVIGLVIFIVSNYYAIETFDLLAIVMALLYIRGPIAEILNILPVIPVARISLAKVNHLFDGRLREEMSDDYVPCHDWNEIKIKDLVFRYSNDEQVSGFEVGPINLDLKRGHIHFLAGGNGSGKSTLAKMISLHYKPSKGCIYFGNEKIEEHNLNKLRQSISAIYLDFYLFDKLLDISDTHDAGSINQYLEKLQLHQKVSVADNRFSTLSLSDGQKKRLALLVTFLEDRNLYVFDEWAADQDPEFKSVFYLEILQYLKERGKTVVVVTHDEAYFHVADQLIFLENGKIKQVIS